MTTTIRSLGRALLEWVKGYTPRWITLVLLTFFAAANFNILNTMEETRTDQRVESRCALRGAFFKLLDIADTATKEKGKPISPASIDFRLYLNENYPPLIPDSECPK